MRRFLRLALILAAVLAALALRAAPGYASANPDQARNELRSRLVSLLDQRVKILDAARQARLQAKKLDKELAEEDGRLKVLRGEQKAVAERLESLPPRLAVGKAALKISEERYAQRLKALYLFGPEASAALLASARDFNQAVSRSQNLTILLEKEKRDLDKLVRQRKELDRLNRRLIFRRAEMDDLVARAREHRTRLAALRAGQVELGQRLEAEDRNLAGNIRAIREAEDRLARTFALNAAPKKPEPAPESKHRRGVEEARGGLSPPVEGEVVGRAGPGGRGVVLKTKPGAPVRSPWSGKVAYAGPLSGYGRVVVMDHGQRVHTVMARLGSLSVEAGQNLEAGAMVGRVDSHGRLYLEVRKSTRPQNPLLWLRLAP